MGTSSNLNTTTQKKSFNWNTLSIIRNNGHRSHYIFQAFAENFIPDTISGEMFPHYKLTTVLRFSINQNNSLLYQFLAILQFLLRIRKI